MTGAKDARVSGEEAAPWFVFAGGGTGGHLFPALAVVEALRGDGRPLDVSFFCTGRPIDGEILGAAGIDARPLPVLPFPSKPWQWPRFLLRWRESVSMCRRAFERHRPAAVVGAGGYASGPPVAAALKMGIRTFLLNPDAVPGRANQHLAMKPGLCGILAQWPVTVGHFPPAAPVVVTGCPVRAGFRRTADQGRSDAGFVAQCRQSFDLEPHRPTLLVTGASQGARTINEAMIHLAPTVAAGDWQVLHLSGPADRGRVRDAYAAAGVRGTVLAFTDRMPEAMAACDLIVSRAGASTLAEIQAAGRASILLPYPFHRDRHQTHNAQVLVEAGAAVLIDDSRDGAVNARRMSLVLSDLMRDDARRRCMGAAVVGLDCPDAAGQIAGLLREAAALPGRENLPADRERPAHTGGSALRRVG